MKKHILYIILLLIIGQISFAQTNYQQEYLKGKSFYKDGKYQLAMEALNGLVGKDNKNDFSEYASFYYALAAYQSSYTAMSRDMLLQIKALYPKWKQMEEVDLWLAKIYFEEGDYAKGLNYSNKIVKSYDVAKQQQQFYLATIDSLELIDPLYQQFKFDKEVGYRYAQLIAQLPLHKQNRDILKQIVSDFGFDEEEFLLVTHAETVKKDTYNVAVMLPFILKKLQPNLYKKGNQFVLDIYDGIEKAKEDLAAEDIYLNTYAYDTEMSGPATAAILENPEIQGMDLFIGPLYPGPSLEVSNFSIKNKVNMVNPVSSNQDVIGNNPFSFLYHPSDASQAKAAAKYTISSQTNKNTMIFYGGSARDSVKAYTYKHLIEQDSFKVVHMEKVEKDTSRHILRLLTTTMADVQENVEDEIVIIDTLTGEKVDLKTVFLIKSDSIGSIYVASDNKLLASSVVSSIEIRPDNIQVIGSTEWLNYRFIDYEAYERLKIVLTASNYINTNSHACRMLNYYSIARYGRPASMYFFEAYDMMMFLGRSLHKYGTLFQNELYDIPMSPSTLSGGISYFQANDNQHVNLVRFSDNEIVTIELPEKNEQANK